MNESIDLWNASLPLRGWFYLVSPAESTPEPGKVIDFVGLSIPLFGVAILLEFILSPITKKRIRLNDAITSITAGSVSQITILFRIEAYGRYLYPVIYENRWIDLEYFSIYHWILAGIMADFCYYWAHRYVHEWNIGWAAHQVHHSSEDYNISTALRQSILQQFVTSWFFLPAALLGVHPSLLYTHFGLNLTYQFWIHTELIHSLGPLEYIFNTPSHHRVHHGRNPFCIDKNYAGVLIIWDRMFGTFASEFATNEPIQYGLVNPINTFDPVSIQFSYIKYVLTKFFKAKGLRQRLRVLFYGPGFDESKPEFRLGKPEDIPKIDPAYTPYEPNQKTIINIYATIMALIGIGCQTYTIAIASNEGFDWTYALTTTAGFIANATAVAALYDKRPIGYLLEALRYIIAIPMLLESLDPEWIEYYTLLLISSSRVVGGFLLLEFYREYQSEGNKEKVQ